MTKDRTVQFRATTAELKRWRAIAKHRGTTLSQWIRWVLQQQGAS